MGVETYRIKCFALGCEKETPISVMTDEYGDFHVHVGDLRWKFSISTKIDAIRIHGVCPKHQAPCEFEKTEEVEGVENEETVPTDLLIGTFYNESSDQVYAVFRINGNCYKTALEPMSNSEIDRIRRTIHRTE